MSHSQYFLHRLIDKGALLRTVLGLSETTRGAPMSNVKGRLMKLILTLSHVEGCQNLDINGPPQF